MPAFRFDSVRNSCEGLHLLRIISTLLLLCAFVDFAPQAKAFALLGPLKNRANNAPDPWQGKPYGGLTGGLGYEQSGDIGGPMFLNEAYRWNVPVIYYGFDQAFVDYFGQPGIEAVESAIAILNALPPASEMSASLSEFPTQTVGRNPAAQSFLDVKSVVLPLLLEQLGLANPERFVWGLRDRSTVVTNQQTVTNYSLIQLNYDPVTLQPSSHVNGALYTSHIFDAVGSPGDEFALAGPWYQFDPEVPGYSSVAGIWDGFESGFYFKGLTRDDVGGLRYLLSRSNRVRERLPPGVTGADSNTHAFQDFALRGGVEKLTFVRLPLRSSTNQFFSVTNQFQDIYFTNGVACTQSLHRVVSEPDILFTAGDLDLGFTTWRTEGGYSPTWRRRSGIEHWQNNSAINGQSGAGGPGVIHPGARITFNRLGRRAFAQDREYLRFAPDLYQWATFSDDPSPIVPHFGPLPAEDQLYLASRVVEIDGIRSMQAFFHGEFGRVYRIETSTNLVDWTFWYSRENPFGIFSIDHPLDGQRRFLRVTRELWPW